jgi:hypothetical protein
MDDENDSTGEVTPGEPAPTAPDTPSVPGAEVTSELPSQPWPREVVDSWSAPPIAGGVEEVGADAIGPVVPDHGATGTGDPDTSVVRVVAAPRPPRRAAAVPCRSRCPRSRRPPRPGSTAVETLRLHPL